MSIEDGVTSGASSPLSTAPSSSPLSWASRTPSPPPDMAPLPPPAHLRRNNPYPSPPASQQTSQSGSPSPDGMDSTNSTDKEGPPPAKRRRVSGERTTEYLDLRSADINPEHRPELDRLMKVLHKRQKIVVIAGAGISVSAGIPDFRSSKGLFKSLKEEHKLKGTGKDLFDASVYRNDNSTSSFHEMVSSMSRMTKDAEPTAFHHMLATIAEEGRLMRLYSQNVDGIDTSLQPLTSSVPLQKDPGGKWPRTVLLHGGLDKMVCSKCHELFDFDANLFSGPAPPPCPRCEEINDIRTNHEGKRSHGIGRLRPRMVLYNEHNPDDEAIGTVTREDLRRRPDAVIVAGTTLKVPGVRRIVREMCGVVRDRRGGVAIWINNDLPPVSKELEDCFDIVVQGPCDEVASHAAMRRWNAPRDPDNYLEITDEEEKKAHVNSPEVQITVSARGDVEYLTTEPLPSANHYNNSFSPPPADATPKRPHKHSPEYSPMPVRHSPLASSDLSSEGDTINVSRNPTSTNSTDGSMTPSRSPSSKPSATQKVPFTLDKFTGTGKPKTQPKKPTNSNPASKKQPKPQTSRAKSSKSKKTTLPQPNGLITGRFTQSKSAVVSASKKEDQDPDVTFPSTPVKTPSKLRQVSNASSTHHLGEPMGVIPLNDVRNNAYAPVSFGGTPSKSKVMFPGLVSEHK